MRRLPGSSRPSTPARASTCGSAANPCCRPTSPAWPEPSPPSSRRATWRAADSEDALLVALDEAKLAHQAAREQVGSRSATHHQLLSSATWCEERAETAAALSAVLFEAEQELEAARDAAEAEARVNAVNEQQAAAEAVLEEAQRQLLELDVAGQSENEVRRSLESANQTARDANAGAEAARARADELASTQAAASAAIAELEQERDSLLHIVGVRSGTGCHRARPGGQHAARRARRRDPHPGERPRATHRRSRGARPGSAGTLGRRAHRRRSRGRGGAGRGRGTATADARQGAVVVGRAGRAPRRGRRRRGRRRGQAGLASSRKRLEEALAAERELLDRLGYPSHLDALLSGGRPSGANLDPNALPQAQEVLAAAESRLHALYDADAAAGNHRRMRADILRMRALGAALLGLTPSEIDPARLRQRRPDPTVADQLAATLRASGAEPDDTPLVERARAWLSARETASTRITAIDQEIQVVTGRARSLTADTEAANASAEERASAARTARRQVEVLEAEMVNRMRPASDPATRAATAAAIRDHIAALEARITAAKSEAEAQNTAASTAGVGDGPVRERPSRHRRPRPASGPGGSPAAQPSDTGEQLLGDLGALADALRKEYKALDESLGELADAVAAAANGEAELAASLAELRAGSADDPEPIDHADALRQLLDPATRTSDVVLDPASGFRGSAREPVLDALVDLGRQRPIVVVDITDDLGAWALRLESGVAALVSADDAQPG